MDRHEHAVRGRHGHRRDDAVRLRERLHAAGVPDRPGRPEEVVRRLRDQEREGDHARLGRDAVPVRPLGPTTQDPSLLGGCRVLDLADLEGAVCGRILADLGADVVKVEPPGGEADRLRPPFLDDMQNSERSIPWLAANVNKRGVTCDLGSPAGRSLFARLAATARIVVESAQPGRLRELGLEDALRETIVVSISPYGQDGPLAETPGSDLEVTAASGSLWLAGEEGRAPVRT